MNILNKISENTLYSFLREIQKSFKYFLIVLLTTQVINLYAQDQIGDNIIYEEQSAIQFGYRTIISDDAQIVAVASRYGSPSDSKNIEGMVAIFKYDSSLENDPTKNVWQRIGLIEGEANYDLSGDGISMSSDGYIIAIGAGFNDGGAMSAGHVRVYQYVVDNGIGNWVQMGNDIDGTDRSDRLGQSLALSGDGKRLAVGIPYADGDGNSVNMAGAVRIYDWNDTSWDQIGEIIHGDTILDIRGMDVDISADGTTVSIVDLDLFSSDEKSEVSIYRYNSDSSAWIIMGDAISEESEANSSSYETSLSADGSIVAIGNGTHDLAISDTIIATEDYGNFEEGDTLVTDNISNAGWVRVFKYSSSTNSWDQMGQSIVGSREDIFGAGLSISADGTILAASAYKGYGTVNNKYASYDWFYKENPMGYLRVYNFNGSQWSQQAEVVGDTLEELGGLGRVDLTPDGKYFVVGSPQQRYSSTNNNDHVKVFTAATDTVAANISSVSLDSTNSELTIQFSESVSGVSNSQLGIDDFVLSISGGTATLNAKDYVAEVTEDQTSWMIKFSTTGTANGSEILTVDLASDSSIVDGFGNFSVSGQINNTVSLLDKIPPRITFNATVGTDVIADGSVTNDATLTLNFTASEAGTGFESDDVTVTNASITNFTASSDTVYSALLTPTAEGDVTVAIDAGAFKDAANNSNIASTQFHWSYDITTPTITITADDDSSNVVINGYTTSDEFIKLNFMLSESSQAQYNTYDFTAEDLTVTGGVISNFLALSSTEYRATFTPESEGRTTIDVAANVFMDEAGNFNTAAPQFSWTQLTTGPVLDILVSNGTSSLNTGLVTSDSILKVTFESGGRIINDFTADDISVSGGTISDFIKVGLSENAYWTATFTPSSEGVATIDIASGLFTDSFGLSNLSSTQFSWTYDKTGPTVSITASNGINEIARTSTTNDSELSITFETSETTTDFTFDDITVSGGTLSDFSALSATTYNAIFTPSSDGQMVIRVVAGVFSDAAGNSSQSIAKFSWFYDATRPNMEITASNGTDEIADVSSTNDSTLILTFTSSEAVTDFTVTDITLSGGLISDFSSTNDSVYTATFTPSADGATTIDVDENSFTDASGNDNMSAPQFHWTYDSTSPSIVITASDGEYTISDGSISNDASLTLEITISESTSNFSVDDIVVSGGTLSSFAAYSSTSYHAIFTPNSEGATTIDIPAGALTDATGNSSLVADQFNWTYKTTGPTLVKTAQEELSGLELVNGGATNDDKIDFTFTLSELSTDFKVDDLVTSLGEFNNFQIVSDTVFTASYFSYMEGTHTVDLPSGSFTDAIGNSNLSSNQFTWEYDKTSPSITISATHGTNLIEDKSSSNDNALTLTFTTSEKAIDFSSDDVSVTGGNLSSFSTSDSTTFIATFTPTSDGIKTIQVGMSVFNDAVSNGNIASEDFNWTYDGTSPSMEITATSGGNGIASGEVSNDLALMLTFTTSEATSDFTIDDLVVSGGKISNFESSSNTVYHATFTPSQDGLTSIDVKDESFTDAAGNMNGSVAHFEWTYNSTPPSMTIIASNGTSEVLDGATTNDASLNITFESSEATLDFTSEDIIVAGGTISNFQVNSENTFTAEFTPTAEGATTVHYEVGAFTNSYGTANETAEQFNWVYKTTGPTMSITASNGDEAVLSGSTTNDEYLIVTFGSSSSTSDFTVEDILVTGGTISEFLASNDTVYSAKFTKSGENLTTIDVASGSFKDATGNANLSATQFVWTHDISGPSITMRVTDGLDEISDGSKTNDPALNLIFSMSEPTLGFDVSDIVLDGGTVSNFNTLSTTEFGAIFTPNSESLVSISVNAGSFTDAFGNFNSDSINYTWTYDKTRPNMIITAKAGPHKVKNNSTTGNPKLKVTFTANEATTDFEEEDITVTGGAISNFTAVSRKVYTAVFTPFKEGLTTINVHPKRFTDKAGNPGRAAAKTYNWTYKTSGPSITISATNGVDEVVTGSTTIDSLLEVTFTTSEKTISFSVDDLSASGGEFSNFQILDSVIYKAIFTPTITGTTTIDVDANMLENIVGNGNRAATQFVWTYDGVIEEEVNQAPILDDLIFSLAENSEVGSFVGTLTATDPDGDALTYVIISGNTSNTFNLDSLTAELKVADSTALDFETMQIFSLEVEVSDGLLSDTGSVVINILDVDEVEDEDEETLGFTNASSMVYPNPSNGFVNIKMAAFKEATIYNLSGKKVLRSTDNYMDVSALSEGVYIIKLENRSGDRFSTRLIKE